MSKVARTIQNDWDNGITIKQLSEKYYVSESLIKQILGIKEY